MMRQGIGLVEVALAVFVVAVLGVPILANVSTAVRETAASEEYMFAEALALEQLAQALAIPLAQLRGDLPYSAPLPEHSAQDERRTKSLKSFQAQLAGAESFTGSVDIDELAPDLLRYRVSVEWPVAPGSGALRHVVLVRFRCPSDTGLRFRETGDEAPHDAALRSVRE